MKKTQFYICPHCGNVLTAMTEASVACCGKTLAPMTPQKAEPSARLHVEIVDNEYFISSDHPMTKECYVTFVALLTGESLILRKQYPEWDLQTRIPHIGHGMLVWYSTRDGLMCQPL